MPKSAFQVYINSKNGKKHKNSTKKSTDLPKAKKMKLEIKNKNENVEVTGKPSSKVKVDGSINVQVKQNVAERNKVETKKRIRPIPVLADVSDDDVIPQLIVPKIPFVISRPENDLPTQAIELLDWLLHPVKSAQFFENYWETKPLKITRKAPHYYKHVFTTNDMDVMLREHPLFFDKNVDIVRYQNDTRITENPSGRAKASIVWDAYSKGSSVRILNPQTYNSKVHAMLATLQEYFGTMVGANVYLTPAGSQGFAPHYDDIEAFIVQLEGRKHWKLYRPKNECENLARFSSTDFKRADLGELIAEITLEAGDLLYFPRGMVHEAKTDDEMHSLHITISTYQRTAYIDLLEKIMPNALKKAAMEDVEFRKGLPIGYLKHVGVINTKSKSTIRSEVLQKVKELLGKICEYANVDDAADEMGANFMYDAVPPVLSHEEKLCTSKYDGERLLEGKLIERGEITPDTQIRLLRQYVIRLLMKNGEANVHFCTENSREYHSYEEQFMTIDSDLCPAVKYLLHKYPDYVSVEELPHQDLSKKVSLVTELWDYGIITTKDPLKIYDDDDISNESNESATSDCSYEL